MDSLLLRTIELSAPLVLAAMGGYLSERAGVVNIGLEGGMLSAACVSALVGASLGGPAGLLAGIFVAILLSLLHCLATQTYRIDHVVSGIAINALAAGWTGFGARYLAEQPRRELPTLPMPFYYAIALLLPFALAAFVARTRAGLRLVAVGGDPDKARLAGISPPRIRYLALLGTGVCTGLSGVAIMSYSRGFTENMTAGNGYIALAALILGGWRPIPSLVAAVAFGFFIALRIQLQGQPVFGMNIPDSGWQALPYLATLIALAGFLGRRRAPYGLGRP